MTRRSLAFYIRLSKQDRDARNGVKDESAAASPDSGRSCGPMSVRTANSPDGTQ